MTPRYSESPLHFWLLHAVLPAALIYLLYLWSEHSGFDLSITQWIMRLNGSHFIDNWFLNDVMHEGVRKLGHVMAYALLASLLASFLVPRLFHLRVTLAFMVLSIAFSSITVVELKHLTNVYCPSSLTLFGGVRPLHSPFDVMTWADHPERGKCWPGGHSSYGFSLWAFYFVAREWKRRLSTWIFAAIFTYGNVLGCVRVVQGAHFLSHQWWTALISWFITLALYVILLRRDLLFACASTDSTLTSAVQRTIE
jgi:membrane-associated PAP2 superfamily phosphatase